MHCWLPCLGFLTLQAVSMSEDILNATTRPAAGIDPNALMNDKGLQAVLNYAGTTVNASYYFNLNQLSNIAAEGFCSDKGGHLASYASLDEHKVGGVAQHLMHAACEYHLRRQQQPQPDGAFWSSKHRIQVVSEADAHTACHHPCRRWRATTSDRVCCWPASTRSTGRA
jgi:hypothetical protein